MSTTTTDQKDRKFLHTLTPSGTGFVGKPLYTIAGAEWQGESYNGDYESLSLVITEPETIIYVRRAYEGDGFKFDWSRKIADGVYVRHSADADSVEQAAAAALAYAPRVLTFSHLDETTWYETAAGRFTAALDGEEAEINKSWSGDDYCWTRSWSPAKTITALISRCVQGQLSGEAPTPEAAMIACIEAPNRFKSACATLVASLREPSETDSRAVLCMNACDGIPDHLLESWVSPPIDQLGAPDGTWLRHIVSLNREVMQLRASLNDIAHSNRTKTGLKELAKAALFPNEEAAC